ncbi:PTS sugar transporter subunit IIA [Candidatus Haliotispira prima]|uniref:Ascorbate-specific PTS system EIIA component n=1 Tax=Candidatus Haliotispira prima TaxID=3034016 RepID=A0ABY8MDW5_9SPIO|nr:PTS sugar transporter subunit IIA [Candidatus Haliotispira prima]
MTLVEHLLSKQTMAVWAEADTWQEAVKLGTDLLERAGVVKPEYYHSILKNVENSGPYFLLGPGIAMPHARPEGGVLETGFSLVTLKKGVNFGDPENDPVRILLTMAAKDATTQNEEAIVQVVELLDDEERVAGLCDASDLDKLKAVLASLT